MSKRVALPPNPDGVLKLKPWVVANPSYPSAAWWAERGRIYLANDRAIKRLIGYIESQPAANPSKPEEPQYIVPPRFYEQQPDSFVRPRSFDDEDFISGGTS